MKPVVLVVEDSQPIQQLYAEELGKSAELLQAFTQESARRYFNDNQGIVCVIVDGNVPITDVGGLSGVRSTTGLIGYIRSTGFSGPILAVSGEPSMEAEMITAGCSEFHNKNERGLLLVLKRAIESAR